MTRDSHINKVFSAAALDGVYSPCRLERSDRAERNGTTLYALYLQVAKLMQVLAVGLLQLGVYLEFFFGRLEFGNRSAFQRKREGFRHGQGADAILF